MGFKVVRDGRMLVLGLALLGCVATTPTVIETYHDAPSEGMVSWPAVEVAEDEQLPAQALQLARIRCSGNRHADLEDVHECLAWEASRLGGTHFKVLYNDNSVESFYVPGHAYTSYSASTSWAPPSSTPSLTPGPVYVPPPAPVITPEYMSPPTAPITSGPLVPGASNNAFGTTTTTYTPQTTYTPGYSANAVLWTAEALVFYVPEGCAVRPGPSAAEPHSNCDSCYYPGVDNNLWWACMQRCQGTKER